MKSKNFYLAISIIILIIISGIYYYKENKGKFEYKGRLDNFKFTTLQIEKIKIYRPEVKLQSNNGYNYTFIYAFRNRPQDLDKVYLEPDLGKKLEGEKVVGIFVTSAPDFSKKINGSFSLAVAPMETILGRSNNGLYKFDIKNVYTEYNVNDPKVEVTTCNDVNDSPNFYVYFRVIELKLGNENKVYTNGRCIIIEGKDEDGVIKSAEKFAYYLIGVF